ncbi:monocarboxylate transporter 9-like [Eriocheir sinensis]|uniref:monocarboxylate transporter 9-like n=1 Tax=Eriocheir sinensis TaxID=95602 RepID=UPI0021C56D9C|nr:monocarboxylate transporter 9-like [Eriocheir sinensis]
MTEAKQECSSSRSYGRRRRGGVCTDSTKREAMTATTTVAEGAAGAKECQERSRGKGDECQDTHGKEIHRDDVDNCCGDGGARGGEDKTPPKHHHHSKSRHRLQSRGDEAAYKLVPPDGGWGWMVALGTFIITSLLPMLGRCFGVLFSEYLLGEGSSSTLTAWIFNAQGFLWNASGFLTRPLTQEFGWRAVALTGSTLAAAGIMISAFTPSPVFLFFSFSLLSGVGGGLVHCQCLTILPHYFARRRGLTNGIVMSGICMGQLMGPPLARFLQDSYGFRGATLIIGALLLNACVGASFFHPPEWHQKKVLVEEEPHVDTPALPTKDKTVGPPDLTNDLVHTPSEASFSGGAAEGEIDGNLAVREKLLEGLGDQRASCSSSRRSSRYNSKLSLSFMDVGSLTALPVEDEPEEEDNEEGRRDVLPVRVMKSIKGDLGALRSLRVCLLCLAVTLTFNGILNFLMMVPFAMLEAGFSLDAAAWCLSVSAGCNLATRFLVGAYSDWRHSNNRLVYKCSFVIIAAPVLAFPLLKSVEGQMAAMMVFGIGVGANMTLFNIVIIDVMGLDHLSTVFGTACLSVAVGSICLGPFIGIMRDVTQSYSVSMWIIGGMVLVGFIVWFFMGLAERVDRRREDGKALKEALRKT